MTLYGSVANFFNFQELKIWQSACLDFAFIFVETIIRSSLYFSAVDKVSIWETFFEKLVSDHLDIPVLCILKEGLRLHLKKSYN